MLLKNERDEWELPGGRIELGESPEECVAREIHEEIGCSVETGPILDSWMYHITVANRDVFVVTYGRRPTDSVAPVLSHEHTANGLFAEAEVADLPLPAGYKRGIAAWFGLLRRDGRARITPELPCG